MATSSLDEETSKKVLRQVEFYFSDSNLPRDGFLRKSIEESEDAMVSLALICSFSRMKSHLGLGGDVKPEDVSEETMKAVGEVLKTSSVLRVSEDGKKIGRSTELLKLEEVVEQLDIRTIAASPFEHNMTMENVESFFTKHAKVNSVRLPRHVADKRFFCGTALVEFSTEEDAESILKQSLVYAGAELELKPKKDFDAEREKLIEEVEKSRTLKGSNDKNSTDGSTNYPKGLIIAFKLKHMEEGSAEQNGIQAASNGNGDSCEKGKEQDSTENATKQSEEKATEDTSKECEEKVAEDGEGKSSDAEKESKEENVTKTNEAGDEKDTEDVGSKEEKSSEDAGKESEEKAAGGERASASLNKDNKEVVLREDLKKVFQRFGTVKFIDYSMGEDSGYIRFEDPDAGLKARAAAVLREEGGLIVKNFIAFLEAVTGDAEKDYWGQLRGGQDKYWENRGNRGGRGGRNFRGGRHNGKHSRSRDNYSSGGRPNKTQRVS